MRRSMLAAAAMAALSLPAAADDMTAAEREAFRAEVRAYLLENPEVLVEALGVLEQRQMAAQAADDGALVRANAEALFEDPSSWVGGNREGDVTIVEFLDYRCGFCRQAHPEVELLLQMDDNVRLIVKEFPILGEPSLLASRWALATRDVAGDEAYKAFHDALMEMRAEITPETLERLAGELGLDAQAIAARADDPDVTRIIADNRALGQRLQISGTPTFVVGERMVRGYVPLDGLLAAVDQARAE